MTILTPGVSLLKPTCSSRFCCPGHIGRTSCARHSLWVPSNHACTASHESGRKGRGGEGRGRVGWGEEEWEGVGREGRGEEYSEPSFTTLPRNSKGGYVGILLCCCYCYAIVPLAAAAVQRCVCLLTLRFARSSLFSSSSCRLDCSIASSCSEGAQGFNIYEMIHPPSPSTSPATILQRIQSLK